MREWKRSGLSAREFAEAIGVLPTTLAWWKWRLGGTGRGVSEAAPRLVAVDVVEDDTAVTDNVEGSGWELMGPDGTRLRAHSRLTGEDLRTVLEFIATARQRQ